jgi:flagellar basal body-associated protein FliL
MEERDYIRDLAEIRSMMERSSKFLSLSGWAGIMAGIYALAGAYVAYTVFNFNPDKIVYPAIESGGLSTSLLNVLFLALVILVLAIGTAIFLSYKKAQKRGENIWHATSRRLLSNMAVPLATGGILILVLLSKGLVGLVIPCTLLFYGLALYNAGKFTYSEVRFLGLIQIGLGLISSYFIEYSLLFWAMGFGVVHIVYGIYIHFRYER